MEHTELSATEAGTAPEKPYKPQMMISVIFLVLYFVILFAVFFTEASDSLNMKQSENSLLGELQILLGVLTAGVGQILSFWFGKSK